MPCCKDSQQPPRFQAKPIHLSFASLALLFPAFYLLVAICSTPAPNFPLLVATQPDVNSSGDVLLSIADAALGPFSMVLSWDELCAQSPLDVSIFQSILFPHT